VDNGPKPPKIFANRVIKQLVGHMFADDFKLKAKDYEAIRVTFRALKGSWDQLGLGDMKQLELLQKVVTAWAALPHEKKSDSVV
jgi:hypothetical protein